MNTINALNVSDELIYANNPLAIILLDSRNEDSNIQLLDIIHKGLGMKMFGYHYYIDKKGDIYSGRPERAYSCEVELLLQSVENNTFYNEELEVKNAKSIVSSGKIFICMEGNTELSDFTVNQRNSLINLCKDIRARYRNIRNIYSMNELLPEYSNLGAYVDMNTIRSEVNSSIVPLYIDTPSGSISYTFGKRTLFYNSGKLLSGNDVKLLQLYFNSIGIPTNTNGIYDVSMYKTVTSFQRSFGLKVDGIFDSDDYMQIVDSIKKLSINKDLSKFHRSLYYKPLNMITGLDIKRLQTKLDSLNYDVDINSLYDSKTEMAIKEFQLANNLTDDGVVGPITWKIIMNYKVITYTREIILSDPLLYGDDIKLIQEVIKNNSKKYGIITYMMDGYYDTITYNNIRKIQSMSNFPINGIVDEKMYNFLISL